MVKRKDTGRELDVNVWIDRGSVEYHNRRALITPVKKKEEEKCGGTELKGREKGNEKKKTE